MPQLPSIGAPQCGLSPRLRAVEALEVEKNEFRITTRCESVSEVRAFQ